MKKFLFLFLLVSNISFSQSIQELEAFGRLLNDAIFYCDKYITPASDAAIYQASSGWVTSPKKRKLWDVTLGFNNNIFFVPKSDRKFEIKNSDFTFFSIRDANWNPVTSASVPTALGTNEQLNLVGNIGANQVYLQTPQGVNAEQVYYTHFTGSVALWFGTELIVKYSPVTKLKSGNYQVHIVKSGDTLWDIAKKYEGTTVNDLKRLNSDLNFKRLKPGMKVKVKNQQYLLFVKVPNQKL